MPEADLRQGNLQQGPIKQGCQVFDNDIFNNCYGGLGLAQRSLGIDIADPIEENHPRGICTNSRGPAEIAGYYAESAN